MVKYSFLKLGLLALCLLVAPAHSADAPSKTTGWTIGNTVRTAGKHLFLAAWVAKGAREYLISTDWNATGALRSVVSDVVDKGKNHLFASVGTVETIAGIVLPTTADWTLRGEATRLGSMAFAIGIPMGIAFLEDKVDDSGFHAIGSLKNHYDTTIKGGYHCYRRHTHHQEFLNPVAQLAMVSLITGAAPIVIDSVISSERPFTVALEATVALGAACLFAQSHLCKKHHTHHLLQERSNELENEADNLYRRRSGVDRERIKVREELARLTLDKNSEEMDHDFEDKFLASA